MYLQRNRYRASDQTPHTFAPSSFKRVLSVFGATGCASAIASVAQFCQRLQSDVKIVSTVAGKHVYSKETHRHDFPSTHPCPQWFPTRSSTRSISILRRLNGDGIGDIPGITAKLGYITDLGCNAIWLNPCFDSPFKDAGYDVRDYKKVAPATAPTTIWRPCSQPPTSAACM